MSPTWDDYYRATAGRSPRELFVRLVDLVREQGVPGRCAVDLGCGDGTETVRLLAEGFDVCAIDQEQGAIDLVLAHWEGAPPERLTTRVEVFRSLEMPPCDLVYAGLSVFFCEPEFFPALWSSVVSALRPAGWLAAHFLGRRDTWAADASMTSHDEAEIRVLFEGFSIEHFAELEHDRPAVSGPKHWHLFEVIARKRSTSVPGARPLAARRP